MLTLERWGRRSIYSLEGRRGTRASALYCAQTEGAGCPGDGLDVRAFPRGRMSGLGGRMSGLEGSATVVSVAWRRMSGRGAGFPGLREEPDVRGWVRMSGPCSTSMAGLLLLLTSSGAGCPGPWPDVRGLEGGLAFFRWFSSSMDLVACPSSRASS